MVGLGDTSSMLILPYFSQIFQFVTNTIRRWMNESRMQICQTKIEMYHHEFKVTVQPYLYRIHISSLMWLEPAMKNKAMPLPFFPGTTRMEHESMLLPCLWLTPNPTPTAHYTQLLQDQTT
jgi:hypothetical protein